MHIIQAGEVLISWLKSSSTDNKNNSNIDANQSILAMLYTYKKIQ